MVQRAAQHCMGRTRVATRCCFQKVGKWMLGVACLKRIAKIYISSLLPHNYDMQRNCMFHILMYGPTYAILYRFHISLLMALLYLGNIIYGI